MRTLTEPPPLVLPPLARLCYHGQLVGREEAYWDEVVNDRRYSNEEWKDDPRTYTRQASREFIKVGHKWQARMHTCVYCPAKLYLHWRFLGN